MRVENVKIHDLDESFKASKYPMTVEPEKCTNEYTSRIKSLGNSKGGHDQFLSGVLVSFDLTCTIKCGLRLKDTNIWFSFQVNLPCTEFPN